MIKETVVKEAESWGIGKKDGQAKPAMTLWDTTNTNSGNQVYCQLLRNYCVERVKPLRIS